jgi:PLD-like domain
MRVLTGVESPGVSCKNLRGANLAILQSSRYLQALCELASRTRVELTLVTAFATVAGLAEILDSVPMGVLRKELHLRWRADDLLSGASDLGIYDAARSKGFAVFMHPALHAKFMLSDRRNLIVGSANFTGRGLGIGNAVNVEVGISSIVDRSELPTLLAILSQSILITPALFAKIRAFIEGSPSQPRPDLDFDPALKLELANQAIGLWVKDLPLGAVPPGGIRDVEDSDIDLELFFSNSKCAIWLRRELTSRNGQAYFGELTAALHAALLEDPLPYRTEVKRLTLNLMNWAAALLAGEFGLDVPSYSQRLFLL